MSVYRVTEVIGVSTESWEAAARTAIETAAGSVRELRIAEVIRQDVTIENGQVTGYRVRLGLSFKYESAIVVQGQGLADRRALQIFRGRPVSKGAIRPAAVAAQVPCHERRQHRRRDETKDVHGEA